MESIWNLIASIVTGFATVVAALSAAYVKLKPALQPLLKRRTAKIALLYEADHKNSGKQAETFLKELQERGYRDINRTANPAAVQAPHIVIILQPKNETVCEQIKTVQATAPDAIALILTYNQLDSLKNIDEEKSKIDRKKFLVSNSELRLFSDLSVLVEGIKRK